MANNREEEEEEEEEDSTPLCLHDTPSLPKAADSVNTVRHKRRKPRLGDSWCPVCGLTLRPGELETHFTQEIDKLVRLPQSRRPSQRPPTPSPSTSSEGNGATPRTQRTRSGRTFSKQWEMYQRVKSNRQVRTRVKRRRKNTSGDSNDHQQDDEYYDDDDDDSVPRRTCPVCEKKVHAEDIDIHIDKCIRKVMIEAEEVDVEGENEGGRQYEEYEWCGQTRVRATQMLRAEGQLHALGTKVQQGCEDEVVDVVDDDSTSVYGPPQYTDADLPPYNLDSDTDEEPSLSFVSNYATTTLRNHSERTTIDLNLSTSRVSTSRGSSGSLHIPSLWSADSINPPQTDGPSASSISNTPAVVEALKARLQELEEDETSPQGRYSCRICHGDYMKPLVSVLCWHVHCENCWLSALSAKKLCPQCSAITSSSDLRRVYF